MATKDTRRKAANVIRNLRGPARAKFRTVMKEFGGGKLMSSSGQKVTSRDQAVAIALSEARRARRRS